MSVNKICYWESMKLAREYAKAKGNGQWAMEVRGRKLYVRLGNNTRYTFIGEAPFADMTT